MSNGIDNQAFGYMVSGAAEDYRGALNNPMIHWQAQTQFGNFAAALSETNPELTDSQVAKLKEWWVKSGYPQIRIDKARSFGEKMRRGNPHYIATGFNEVLDEFYTFPKDEEGVSKVPDTWTKEEFDKHIKKKDEEIFANLNTGSNSITLHWDDLLNDYQAEIAHALHFARKEGESATEWRTRVERLKYKLDKDTENLGFSMEDQGTEIKRRDLRIKRRDLYGKDFLGRQDSLYKGMEVAEFPDVAYKDPDNLTGPTLWKKYNPNEREEVQVEYNIHNIVDDSLKQVLTNLPSQGIENVHMQELMKYLK